MWLCKEEGGRAMRRTDFVRLEKHLQKPIPLPSSSSFAPPLFPLANLTFGGHPTFSFLVPLVTSPTLAHVDPFPLEQRLSVSV